MARYGQTIEVDVGKTPSSQNDFVWLATEDNFPTAAVDGGSTSILNGGGNLRCYTDDTKSTQLPVDVVTFVTGGTPSIQVWGLSPTLNVASTVYIEADTVAISQPAVTDTYGRNAVWADSYGQYHFKDVGTQTDVTGNSHNLTQAGISTQVTGKIGNAVSFNGTNTAYSDGTIRGDHSFSLSFWVKVTSSGSNKFIYDDSTTAGVQVFVRSTGVVRARLDDSGSNFAVIDSTSTIDDSTWHHVSVDVDKSALIQIYIDGAQDGATSNISTFGNIAPTANADYGKQAGGSSYFLGDMDESSVSIENSSLYVLSQYNNQNDPSTFWITGAWEDQDAGGTILTSNYYTMLMAGN